MAILDTATETRSILSDSKDFQALSVRLAPGTGHSSQRACILGFALQVTFLHAEVHGLSPHHLRPTAPAQLAQRKRVQ